MPKATSLNAIHRAAGARMVDFGGWDMPVNYGSQIDEHHAVRRDAGMFDVSHMRVVDIHGAPAAAPRDFLRYALANNVDKLKTPGKALYSCLLADDGGVLDDLIVYFLREDFFRLVVNAATADKDIAWLTALAARAGARGCASSRAATSRSSPCRARRRARKSGARFPAARRLAPRSNRSMRQRLPRPAWASCSSRAPATRARTVSRSSLPAVHAEALWRALVAQGVAPCGLGARDTLRLEAGMNLYGQDMDETRLAAGVRARLDRRPRERRAISSARPRCSRVPPSAGSPASC